MAVPQDGPSIVEEAQVTEERDGGAGAAGPGARAEMPRALDTSPSMPLAPRFASTAIPSRGAIA